jgi:hypothetical protein
VTAGAIGAAAIFDADGPSGIRFTMTEPWTTLMLDDERVIHETTPIQPIDPAAPGGHRDTLVLTFRARGFQGPGQGKLASPARVLRTQGLLLQPPPRGGSSSSDEAVFSR